MRLKKILIGEEIPDKNDSRYKERREREMEAGRKFARFIGLTWLGYHLQLWGQNHKKTFLVSVFVLVFFLFFFNVFRLIMVYKHTRTVKSVAVERVDSAMRAVGRGY